ARPKPGQTRWTRVLAGEPARVERSRVSNGYGREPADSLLANIAHVCWASLYARCNEESPPQFANRVPPLWNYARLLRFRHAERPRVRNHSEANPRGR